MRNFKHIFSIILLISAWFVSIGQERNLNLKTDSHFKNSSPEFVETLLDSCWENRVGNPNKALEYGFMAIWSIQNNENLQTYSPRANNYIGVIYLNYLYDYKSALPYFHRALKNSQQLNDSLQIAYSYNNLGDVYYFIKNNALALQYGKRSLAIFQELQDTIGTLYSLTNVGVAFLNSTELDSTIQYFKIQVKIATELNLPSRLAYAKTQIGNVYLKIDSLETALKYYDAALELIPGNNDIKLKTECLNGIGTTFYKMNRLAESHETFEYSLKLALQINYIYSEINAYRGLSLVHAKTNNIQEGLFNLENATTLSNNIGYPLYIIDVFETKIEFYKLLNDDFNVKKTYTAYINTLNTFLSEQTIETIEVFEQSIEDQQTITDFLFDLKKSKQNRLYFLFIIALLILFSVILYYRSKAISELNLKLKESNNTKDKLFSIISHDLRSPFNSALGFSDLILIDLENEKDSDSYRYAKTLNKSLNNTLNLLNNLLNWAKSNKENFNFQPENIQLNELINEIIELFAIQFENKKLSTTFVENKNIVAFAERGSVFNAISNLISNAIKFTPTDGNITIELNELPSFSIIKIADTGIGIPEKHIGKLFDIKESKSTLGTNNESGNGLGLLITKDLVEKNGGKISVQNNLDKGTTFTIELPKPKPPKV